MLLCSLPIQQTSLKCISSGLSDIIPPRWLSTKGQVSSNNFWNGQCRCLPSELRVICVVCTDLCWHVNGASHLEHGLFVDFTIKSNELLISYLRNYFGSSNLWLLRKNLNQIGREKPVCGLCRWTAMTPAHCFQGIKLPKLCAPSKQRVSLCLRWKKAYTCYQELWKKFGNKNGHSGPQK